MKKQDAFILAAAALVGGGVMLLGRQKQTSGVGVSRGYIEQVLRSMDRTEIFKLHHDLYGNTDRGSVYDFIKQYAPNNQVWNAAYRLAYGSGDDNYFDAQFRPDDYYRHGVFEPLSRQAVLDYVKMQVQDPSSPYAKRPVKGSTHLWFVSPRRGFSDYNKVRSIPLEGNEEFVDRVIAYADRYFL